jgi:hypothetical protein
MTELWKDIPGYNGAYQASNLGRIKSLLRKERILNPYINDVRCHRIAFLRKNGKGKSHKVHRLVMEAFVGPCPEGMEVRHLDGDGGNNNLVNLRYGTHKENMQDTIIHGTSNKGIKYGKFELTKRKLEQIRLLIQNKVEDEKILSIINGLNK